METKGMFKRIAALTLAALTVVTSSGIDYNLLSANAAESATQVTDVSTESTLQTKNAKVNAFSKISFSTDEDLKQAVEDGSYTVDVETNKVKVASIKYNKTLLEMGTDFTATAKRTSATTKKIDGVYKYTYTITITGKGKFTGTAKKTGVTMKSQIKPKVTTKKKTVKKADANDGYATIDAKTDQKDGTLIGKIDKWSISVSEDDEGKWVLDDSSTNVYKRTYFTEKNDSSSVDFDDQLSFELTYNGVKTSISSKNIDVHRTGTETGYVKLTTPTAFQTIHQSDTYYKGVIINFNLKLSVTANSSFSFYLIQNSDTSTKNKVSFNIGSDVGSAENPYYYTGSSIQPDILVEADVGGTKMKWSSNTNVAGIQSSTIKSELLSGLDSVSAGPKVLNVTLPDEPFDGQEIQISYEIKNSPITVGDQKSITYDGKEIKGTDADVDYAVTDSAGNILTKGDNGYKITFDKTVKDAGTYTATIEGTGAYSGTVTKDFVVSQKEIKQDDVTSTKDELNKLYVKMDDQTWDGEALKPKPSVVSYAFDADTIDSIADTDYTIDTYESNDKVGTGKVTLTLKGNYTGTITQNFTINKGNIAAAGNTVEVYRDKQWISAGTLTGKAASGSVETLTAASNAFIYFTPVNTETPQIRVKNKNGKVLASTQDDTSSNFNLGTPQSTGKTWGTDFASTWTLNVTGKGDNFDNGKSFELKLTMQKLPLSDSHIQIRATNMNSSTPTADVYYVATDGTESKLIQKTKTNTNGDYTVSKSGTGSAGKVSAVITAAPESEKYTGSKTADASYGYDLSKATMADGINAGDLRISYYDPFTGKKLSAENGKIPTMPYYGTDKNKKVILPHVIIEKYDGNNKYTVIGENNYTVSDPELTRQDNNGNEYYTLTINSDSENGGELYSKISGLATTFVIERMNLSDANVYSTTNSDGTLDILPDNNSLTSYTDFDTVNKEVKIYVKPHNAGKVIILASSGGTTTSTPYDQTDKNLETAKQNAYAYWTAPDPWSDITDNYDGILLTTAAYEGTTPSLSETGFTIKQQELKDKTVIAHGTGHYTGAYTIHLDMVDIGKSSDIEVSPVPQTDAYDWTGYPIFPIVGLYQKSTGEVISKENFYIIYENDTTHMRYVLSQDKDGKITSKFVGGANDIDGTDLDSNADSSKIASTIGKDAKQTDPISTQNGTTINYAKNFIDEGTYTIYIQMKDGTVSHTSTSGQSDKGNTTKLYGKTNGTTKVKTYTIKKKDISSRITAKFSPTTVDFAGKDNATDYLPQLTSSSKNKGPKLSVTDNQNSKKTMVAKSENSTSYDYELNYAEDDEYFKYPGLKTVTITGNGEYSGETTASYTLKGDLSKLNDENYFEVTGLDGFTKNAGSTTREIVYTDATGGFKTANGNSFSLDNIRITVAGTTHELGSDEITISPTEINTEGNYDIVISPASGSAYKGSYTIKITVKESRSGLVWNNNNSDTIELPYKSNGYTLGDDELALKSTFSEKTVTLNRIDSNGSVGDSVTITPNDPRGTDTGSVRPQFTEPGTYNITISGPPQANQSSTLVLVIKYDLSQVKVDFGISQPYYYSGKDPFDPDFENKVKVTVPGKDDPLIYGKDYTISRDKVNGGYTDAGTYKVTIGPATNGKFFSTEPSFSYEIVSVSESDKLTVPNLTKSLTLTYDGTEKTIPESALTGKVIYDGTTTPLVYGTDYDITYPDGNINAGENLRYTVVGKGNYSGLVKSGYFAIKPFDLSNATDVTPTEQQYFAGDNIEVLPKSLKITISGSSASPLTITADSDYDITSISNTTKVSGSAKAKANISGKGNYTGNKEIEYVIDELSMADAEITVTSSLPYTGNYYSDPSLYVKASIPGVGRELVYGTDFTIELTRTADGDNKTVNQPISPVTKLIDAGDYSVVLIGKDTNQLVKNGSRSSAQTLHIEPMDITNQESQYRVENQEWDGTVKTPDVYRGTTKVDSTWLTYSGNRTKACGSLAEMRLIDSAYSEADLPTVTVTGHGNYKGSVSLHFKIGHPFSEAVVSVNGDRITYDGDSHKNLSFTITSPNSSIEISKVKYTVTYPDDMTNAGDKKIALKATDGAFYGTKTVTATIYPVSGSAWTAEFAKLTMDSTGQYVTQYEGAAITPEVKAYAIKAGGTKTEIPEASLDIKYSNNTAAGTASVTVKSQNYEGTKTLYFKILGVDISGDDVYAAFTDGITRRQYTGSALTPAVTVTFAGSLGTVTLRKDVDFSLTYENNTKAGAADVKITGIGNYSGTKTLDFDIFANLNDKTSVFTIPKQMYTGEAITELTGATLKAGGNDLKLGTDYTLSITSTDSFRTKGTAIFTAQGKYYEGTRTVQFEIGNDASMYNILGVASTYVYDRQAHKPVPVVTDKQGTVYSVDSVTYASTSDGDTCINAGNVKMQIVITSHGQSVTIPYNYTIEPKNINTASITPIADVDYNGKAHTPTIRITDGTNLLTGSPTSWDGTADFVYTYYNNVQPGTATVSIQGINNYTGVANVYFAINVKAAPQMIVTAMPSGRLKVTWKKVSGVSGYRIFYSSANGTQKQTTLSSSKKSTYITGLTRGVVYTVGLQSFITANGQNGYSTASVQQIATSTSKPKITSAKSTGKGKIKITWKKVSNATAYMVYRKTAGSSKWVRVKTTKSTSFTNTGLKSGKKYTYKVISYKQSGVKRSFSKYSTGKTVKAK